MTLGAVRSDLDQPLLRGREQQRADWRIEGAVSDIERALGIRAVGQAVVQGAQVGLGNFWAGPGAGPRTSGSSFAVIGLLLLETAAAGSAAG